MISSSMRSPISQNWHCCRRSSNKEHHWAAELFTENFKAYSSVNETYSRIYSYWPRSECQEWKRPDAPNVHFQLTRNHDNRLRTYADAIHCRALSEEARTPVSLVNARIGLRGSTRHEHEASKIMGMTPWLLRTLCTCMRGSHTCASSLIVSFFHRLLKRDKSWRTRVPIKRWLALQFIKVLNTKNDTSMVATGAFEQQPSPSSFAPSASLSTANVCTLPCL